MLRWSWLILCLCACGELRSEASSAALQSELVLRTTRQTLTARIERYEQQWHGLRVLGSEVIVRVDEAGRHTVFENLVDLSGLSWPVLPRLDAPLVVVGSPPRIAHRILQATDAALLETLIDVETGEVLSSRDLRQYVDGTGLVFDPNPVASTGNTLLADNNDADSPALSQARRSVTLPRLDGTGVLRGAYVDAMPVLSNQRATSPSLMFNYQRSDDRFEEVNAYFHLDRAQDRIRSLGFTNVNSRRIVAYVNEGNTDNAYYNPFAKDVHFGAGGVDNAEDGDMVVHEYGHAVLDDQVPGFGVFGTGGDARALGEGFSDYLSAEVMATRSPQITDPACFAEWDSAGFVGARPCLRRVDGHKHFPESMEGESHADGEVWSAALWSLQTELGADVVTRMVLEANFSLPTNATFMQAADAVLAADQALDAGSHETLLRRTFIRYGLTRRVSPSYVGTPSVVLPYILESSVGGGQYANSLDQTQTITVPDAGAIAVHFLLFDLEGRSRCFDGGCDNLYVLNADGDLFDVLNGQARTDVTTAAVPGDTIKLRLVTDSTAQFDGYYVDSLIVYAPELDAGVLDAGVSDAGSLLDAGAADAGAADAGAADAGEPVDGGFDAGVSDAGSPFDAGAPDAGAEDAGAPFDAGVADSGSPVDAGVPDSGTAGIDAGSSDTPMPMRPGCGCSDAQGLGLLALALISRLKKRRTQ